MTESFVWDYGTETERWTEEVETVQILQEIHHEFVKNDKIIQYSHKASQKIMLIYCDVLLVQNPCFPKSIQIIIKVLNTDIFKIKNTNHR